MLFPFKKHQGIPKNEEGRREANFSLFFPDDVPIFWII
jgi:hypothetical protein